MFTTEESVGKAVAIITARGGSKRIPYKNIKEFCGRPIISYSIYAAQDAGCFDEVMVSTDDEKIAQISMEYGAKIPFMRSKKNSGDFASTVDVIEEVIESYKKIGKEFEKICCIYPTAPFVTGEKLRKAFHLLENADSVVPVVRFSFPPLRAVEIKNGIVTPVWEEYMSYRSQDLPEMYHDCGQFYCIWTQRFLENRGLLIGKTISMELEEWEVQDIDNLSDWKMAELKYRFMNNELN